jgi:hypothetical protein
LSQMTRVNISKSTGNRARRHLNSRAADIHNAFYSLNSWTSLCCRSLPHITKQIVASASAAGGPSETTTLSRPTWRLRNRARMAPASKLLVLLHAKAACGCRARCCRFSGRGHIAPSAVEWCLHSRGRGSGFGETRDAGLRWCRLWCRCRIRCCPSVIGAPRVHVA